MLYYVGTSLLLIFTAITFFSWSELTYGSLIAYFDDIKLFIFLCLTFFEGLNKKIWLD